MPGLILVGFVVALTVQAGLTQNISTAAIAISAAYIAVVGGLIVWFTFRMVDKWRK